MSEAFSESNQLYLDGTTCIQDLHSPQAFVSTILHGIDTAQDQVILSALYLGTGSLESQIVEHAEKALQDKSRPNFKITFFFDHSRGQRGNINSVTLLTDLVAKFHPRAQVFLYQMPQLRGFMDYLPLQLKELLGVYHCKFSVFDNKAILTGANLSYDYFTDRQDRYFLIGPHNQMNTVLPDDCALFHAHRGSTDSDVDVQSDNTNTTNTTSNTAHNTTSTHHVTNDTTNSTHNTLAHYLTRFAAVVSKESHQLLPNGSLQAPKSVHSGSSGSSMGVELLALVRDTNATNTDILTTNTNNTTTAYTTNNHTTTTSTTTTNTNNIIATPAPTRIHPLIQHAPLHIYQESTALLTLFTQSFCTLHNALLCVATPYTNFRSVFLQTILSTLQYKCSVELCVPSVPAHGFGSAKGLLGFVPALHYYSLQVEAQQGVAQVYSSTVGGHEGKSGDSVVNTTTGGSDKHTIINNTTSTPTNTTATTNTTNTGTPTTASVYNTYYYLRPQWTYHTKGIWLFPDAMTHSSGGDGGSSGDGGGSGGVSRSGGVSGGGSSSSSSSSSSTNTTPATQTTNNKHTTNHNVVTYIGSSNFGERSWSRDFELGFVLATSESPLQQLFKQEYLNMRQHCGVEQSSVSSVGSGSVGCGINASMYKNIRTSVRNNRIGAPVVNVVSKELLPRHNSVQKWFLYAVARVIRSFL